MCLTLREYNTFVTKCKCTFVTKCKMLISAFVTKCKGEDIMSEFNQQKYIQEYCKENYDRCIFNVPKGFKNVIARHYLSKGYKSLNAYVNDLIAKDMEGEGDMEVIVKGTE